MMIVKKLSIALIVCLLSVNLSAQRERINFDKDWQFAFGNASDFKKDFGNGIEYFNYLTKANSIHNEGPYTIKFKPGEEWKTVDLPHDWAVDLPFNPSASYSHGFKTVGWKYPETSVGWYRKTFLLPKEDEGKHFRIQFDGIFRNAQIWVNGIYLGVEPSGYKHQDYDITDYLLFDEETPNLICVRCDASLEEGWFYEGAGIYRHVWLEKSNPLHITTGGTFIHSQLTNNYTKAILTFETEVCNDSNEPMPAYLVAHSLINSDGKVVATTETSGKSLLSRETENTIVTCEVDKPALWDIENPNLYNVLTKIVLNGKVVDEYTTRIGIREIRMDKNEGLFLNGKHVKLKGFNNHQDHAGVGAAIPDGLIRYRMERLKWMGANAYRASHNPTTAELLDVCDELGILVIDENRLLGINDFQLSVMQNMIKRGRNHPSVFLWSIGNEEWGLEWEIRGTRIATTMREYAHRADSTRPMTVASSSGPNIVLTTDVAGYNYIKQHPIEEHRQNYPERVAAGTEETTGCGTRGVYFPIDEKSGRMMSMNFDKSSKEPLGFAMERGWNFYNDRPWLLGLFYWTGFDYRGEPTPLQYPATGSRKGVLDYCGFPKDEAYYLKSWWTNEPVLHIMPHWNLEGHEGETIETYVFSNCDEVELNVNGKKLGRKKMPLNGHLSWETVYKPGYIQAIGYKNGKEVIRERLETTGSPANVVAEIHQYDNLYVVNVSTTDSKNRYVPTATLPLKVHLEGNVRILGSGNGDSAYTDVERPSDANAKDFEFKTFNGLAQIILNADDDNFNFTIGGEQLQSFRYKQ